MMQYLSSEKIFENDSENDCESLRYSEKDLPRNHRVKRNASMGLVKVDRLVNDKDTCIEANENSNKEGKTAHKSVSKHNHSEMKDTVEQDHLYKNSTTSHKMIKSSSFQSSKSTEIFYGQSDKNCQLIKSVNHDEGQDDKMIINEKKFHLSKSSDLIQVGSGKIDEVSHINIDCGGSEAADDDDERLNHFKINTPTRSKITRGKVANIRDMFDNRDKKVDAVDPFKLRKKPMKPITPNRGRRKRGRAICNSSRTDLSSSKQTLISQYYRGEEVMGKESEASRDDTG